ncbi:MULTISPECIES: response regulator transcription factor [Priestia]|uniref:response regulator transcription factor n=1 Tax=Priestia TaxID=2800373 RepID=UPI00178348A6|nr:response regulator transcription factor [Priestia megaterium]MBD8844086.1 response regulator transcription factor [Priestia megaterium]
MIHILLADDDEHMRQLVRHYLQLEGYVVHEAEDGEEASGLLAKQHIHLAVVDIMMPHKDGYEVCEEIRSYYDFPIILLTAKDQLEDKEKGFLAGTDDYVTKPFEPKELIFRIKALLRRYEVVNEKMIVLNNTSIDRKSYEVHCSGRLLILPMKEFELLAQLASYPGRIFTREVLIHLIWGADFNGDNRTIDVHVKRLRERFEHTDDFFITTVRGVGYKLEVKAK